MKNIMTTITTAALTAIMTASVAQADVYVSGMDCYPTQDLQSVLEDNWDERVSMEGSGHVYDENGEPVQGIITVLESDDSYSVVFTTGGMSCLVAAGGDLMRLGVGI